MADESEPDTFGWELLYALYESKFTRKVNVIIVWSHFNLVRRGFKNAGLGENTILPQRHELKETLPLGWNDKLPCRMRYFYNKKLYFLTIMDDDEDGDVMINLNRPCDNNTTLTTMHCNEIKKLTGSLDEIMSEWPLFMKRITDDIIDPFIKNDATKDVDIQTDLTDEEPVRKPKVNPISPAVPLRSSSREWPVLGVGAADLYPLSGGGGMLFEPPIGPPPFNRAIPPGARFDPILPNFGGGSRPGPRPGPNPRLPRNNFPDHDHLPPPGYDDMFS